MLTGFDWIVDLASQVSDLPVAKEFSGARG
jgi:hypothetical protein